MLLIFKYIFLSFLIIGCSTKKFVDPFKKEKAKDLKDVLQSLDKKAKANFGPTDINEFNHFIDKSTDYGLSGVEAVNFNVVDLDRDGYSDLVILPNHFSSPVFYLYNKHSQKFEKTRSYFRKPVKASYLLFYDINRDNVTDAIVGVLNQKSELTKIPIKIFLGKMTGGKLEFRKNNKFLKLKPTPASAVSLIDYNLDGKLDMFVSNWFDRYKGSPIPHTDYLLENKGKRFSLIKSQLLNENDKNVEKTMFKNAYPTFGSSVCDIDQNGFPDILTTSTNRYPNKLWMNKYNLKLGKRFFQDYGKESRFSDDVHGKLTPRGGGRTFSAVCADYNNDTIMDLYIGEISHNYDNENVDRSSILTGSRFKFPPVFIRTEYLTDANDLEWNQADRRAIWFDYNNDGLLDLLVDNSGYPPHSRLILFEQDESHAFSNVSKIAGIDIINPLSSVILDINRDGKMDILTAQSNIRNAKMKNKIYLFENQIKNDGRRSIRFYLEGKKANGHALGAMIILKTKKNDMFHSKRQIVEYSYGGLPPQNEEGILFGLDAGESIEQIRVRWPYTKKLNQSRAGLEKIYHVKYDFKETMNVTLCENGEFLIGRRGCEEIKESEVKPSL